MKKTIIAWSVHIYMITLARGICSMKGHVYVKPGTSKHAHPIRVVWCARCGVFDETVFRAREGKNPNIHKDASHS